MGEEQCVCCERFYHFKCTINMCSMPLVNSLAIIIAVFGRRFELFVQAHLADTSADT